MRRLPALSLLGASGMAAAILLGGCVNTPRRAPSQEQVSTGGGITAAPSTAPGAGAGSLSIEGYAAAIKSASDRTDHEPDAKARADLATEATNNADACLTLDPHAVACQYGKAVATGLEARAHPARAAGLLSSMLQSLETAESTDPNYDNAGPARVRALVLIRAPGWPLGPGDTDAGLAAARRAVALQPNYPPNVLALAEALFKTGDGNGARESYARARALAQALPAGPDRDDWLREADDGLKHR